MTGKEAFHMAQQITFLKHHSMTTRFSDAKARKTEEQHKFDNWPSVWPQQHQQPDNHAWNSFFPWIDCSSPAIHKSIQKGENICKDDRKQNSSIPNFPHSEEKNHSNCLFTMSSQHKINYSAVSLCTQVSLITSAELHSELYIR